MMQKLPAFAAASLMMLGLWTACTKPTPFGAELLNDQVADYDYTDTLTVECSLEREDSTVTSDRTSTASFFLCGEVNDFVFGHSSSEIYSLMQLGVLDPGFDSSIHKLDSVVLFLRLDNEGFYGDTLLPQNLYVHRLTEPIDNESSYYSHRTLQAGAEIGSLLNFRPQPNKYDSVFVSTSKAPVIRIPLSNAFGNELLHLDSVALSTDTAFYNRIRGIRITASPAGATGSGAMMAFDLNDATYSRLRIYYSEHDTTKRTYDFYFQGCNKFTHFSHNYAGSAAGERINKPCNDLMYVQGMNGLRLKVVIPFADALDNIVVNDADLVLTAATVPGDDAHFNPAKQLVMTQSSGDTLYTFTSDVTYSLGPTGTGGFDLFGGLPISETDNGVDVVRYRLALSQHLQDMVDDTSGDLKKKTVYVNVYPQNRSAMRAILYGPKSATYPAKIALKYTRL